MLKSDQLSAVGAGPVHLRQTTYKEVLFVLDVAEVVRKPRLPVKDA